MSPRSGWKGFAVALVAPVLVLALALMLASPARATPIDPTGPSPLVAPSSLTMPQAIPGAEPTPDMKLARSLTSRLTLAVTVNGQGPYDFLIDTGSDRTVISRELATTLNLAPGPAVHMQESTGDDVVSTVRIPQLQIGQRTLTDIDAPAVSAADLGAMGMLGVDALRDLRIVMDFKSMRLSSSPSHWEPDDPGTVVVRGKNRLGALILVDAEIHGIPVLVVVDSGAEISVGNAALLKLLTGRRIAPSIPRQGELIGVTGRRIPITLETISEAHIGQLEIANMTLGFADLPVFERFGLDRQPAILLGMDIMSGCRKVAVDIRRREATFTLY